MFWYPNVGFGSKLPHLLGQNLSCCRIVSNPAVGEIGTLSLHGAQKQGGSAHSVSRKLRLPIFSNLDLK